MKVPRRISLLFFLGFFVAGSTALGYYYYFVYGPPLKAAEQFMDDMEKGDIQAVRNRVVVSSDIEEGMLREPTDRELKHLMSQPFERGRIVDQRPHEGRTRNFYYLVYREPDGRIYALIATEFNGRFRIVIPETPLTSRNRYLWDYQWTN